MAGAARDGGGDRTAMEEPGRKEGAATTTTKVPFLRMFRYADRADAVLMAVGTVAAVANGMSEPLMTVIFAAIIECFGAGDDNTVLHRVSKVHTQRNVPAPGTCCYVLNSFHPEIKQVVSPFYI